LPTPEELRQAALAALRGDRLNEALPCYRVFLALRPNEAAMWINYGIALRRKGKLKAALACQLRARGDCAQLGRHPRQSG